ALGGRTGYPPARASGGIRVADGGSDPTDLATWRSASGGRRVPRREETGSCSGRAGALRARSRSLPWRRGLAPRPRGGPSGWDAGPDIQLRGSLRGARGGRRPSTGGNALPTRSDRSGGTGGGRPRRPRTPSRVRRPGPPTRPPSPRSPPGAGDGPGGSQGPYLPSAPRGRRWG